MKVLVISAASGRTAFDETPVSCREIDDIPRSELVDTYPDLAAPAADLYVGREHETVEAAVDDLRAFATVDWYLLSAGYGLVPADAELVAEECSFADIDGLRDRVAAMGYPAGEMTNREIRRTIGTELGIPARLHRAMKTGYDLVFVALPSDHFAAMAPALEAMDDDTTAIAIAADSAADAIGGCHRLPATDRERTLLGSNWVDLRGDLFAQLVAVLDGPADLEAIRNRPDLAYFNGLGMA